MIRTFSSKNQTNLGYLALLLVASGSGPLVQAETMFNNEAVIPPQCYTKTEGRYNPCYICHQSHPEGTRRNYMDDGDLQGDYQFSDVGVNNQWDNLFKSRDAEIAAITDEQILEYVRQDNYSALLAAETGGYVPDLQNLSNPQQAFDEQGFARDGSGWVAFNYKPLPSTFWPTNGSYDDVMIRLPEAFRQDAQGQESRALYLLNLSLVEMAIKDLTEISIPSVDEEKVGADLDGNGVLANASTMVVRDHYLGAAANVAVERQLYPVGTEFIHSVRYLDVTADGDVIPAPRLKELRYSLKYRKMSEMGLKYTFNQEHREKAEGKLPHYSWAQPIGEAGMVNKLGWKIQGWIEDESGELRLQNYEENFFCMGCHTTTGTHVDSTLAFPRKVTGARGWGYIDLKGMTDVPNYGEPTGEIATYLKRVGGGDEFRQNLEMIERWFNADGSLKRDAVESADVHTLITPSPERALRLNKAYQRTVSEQSFYLGRDAVLGHPTNVFAVVDPDQVPVLPESRQFYYDLRLQWPDGPQADSATPVAEPEAETGTQTPTPGNQAGNADNSEDADSSGSGGAFSFGFLMVVTALASMLRQAQARVSRS